MDIHWHQDPLRRVIEVRGEIDESFVSHLSRSMVDLGRRDLLIDLSECTPTPAVYENLRYLERRLGSRTLSVLVKADDSHVVELQETDSLCPDI